MNKKIKKTSKSSGNKSGSGMNKKNSNNEKTYFCIECNRVIHHKGRCFACNKTAKMRRDAQDRKYE